jgi:hypothetical protein
VGHLDDIMARVRDHMRTQPPRSAAPRKRRPKPTTPATTQGLGGSGRPRAGDGLPA